MPESHLASASKIPNGLEIFNDFITVEEEIDLIKFLNMEEKSRSFIF